MAGIWQLVGPAAALSLVVLALALVVVRTRRDDRFRAADDLGTWGGVYLGYVLLTTTVSPSLFRYALLVLVPLEPLRRALTAALRRTGTLGVVGVALVLLGLELGLQWWWVRTLWVVADAPVLAP